MTAQPGERTVSWLDEDDPNRGSKPFLPVEAVIDLTTPPVEEPPSGKKGRRDKPPKAPKKASWGKLWRRDRTPKEKPRPESAPPRPADGPAPGDEWLTSLRGPAPHQEWAAADTKPRDASPPGGWVTAAPAPAPAEAVVGPAAPIGTPAVALGDQPQTDMAFRDEREARDGAGAAFEDDSGAVPAPPDDWTAMDGAEPALRDRWTDGDREWSDGPGEAQPAAGPHPAWAEAPLQAFDDGWGETPPDPGPSRDVRPGPSPSRDQPQSRDQPPSLDRPPAAKAPAEDWFAPADAPSRADGRPEWSGAAPEWDASPRRAPEAPERPDRVASPAAVGAEDRVGVLGTSEVRGGEPGWRRPAEGRDEGEAGGVWAEERGDEPEWPADERRTGRTRTEERAGEPEWRQPADEPRPGGIGTDEPGGEPEWSRPADERRPARTRTDGPEWRQPADEPRTGEWSRPTDERYKPGADARPEWVAAAPEEPDRRAKGPRPAGRPEWDGEPGIDLRGGGSRPDRRDGRNDGRRPGGRDDRDGRRPKGRDDDPRGGWDAPPAEARTRRVGWGEEQKPKPDWVTSPLPAAPAAEPEGGWSELDPEEAGVPEAWPAPLDITPDDDLDEAPAKKRRGKRPSGPPADGWDGGGRTGGRPPRRRRRSLMVLAIGLTAVVAAAAVVAAGTIYRLVFDQQTPGLHTIAAPLDGRTKGELELAAGADAVTVTGADLGADMFQISTPESDDAIPLATIRGDRTTVTFASNRGEAASAVEIRLNSKVPWLLVFTAGATTRTVDFSAGQLSGLEMAGGATRLELTLPKPDGTVPIKLRGGLDELLVHAPKGIPTRVKVTKGATEVTLDRFNRKKVAPDTTFTPDGWERAKARYDIDAAEGIGTVKLDRR